MTQKDHEIQQKRMRAEFAQLQAQLDMARALPAIPADTPQTSASSRRSVSVHVVQQRDRAYTELERVVAYLERWLQGPSENNLIGLTAESSQIINTSAPTGQSIVDWLNAVLRRAPGLWPAQRKLKSLNDPHLLKGVLVVLEVIQPSTALTLSKQPCGTDHPTPSLTIPHISSPSHIIPHHPLSSLTIPHYPSTALITGHHTTSPHTIPHHPPSSQTIPHHP